jgi:DNA primase
VLPLLQPGRTIRIATLPEGIDPDDLIRQQGRAAFADVLARARSLSDMIWSLETNGGMVPEPPEERAALEQRLRQRANGIAEPSVRRHYMQAFDERLAAFFAPVRPARFDGQRGRGRGQGQGRGYPGTTRATPRLVVSDTLRNSRLLKPGRSVEVTPREAAIIMTLVNHPALIESRMEALAALDLASPSARGLMTALLDVIAHDHGISPEGLSAALGARGFGQTLERLGEQLHKLGVWQAERDAADMDAETGLKHTLALHNKSVELNRELKAAEQALGNDPSEEANERLRDIQNQITTVDGTEALIEGFGSLSGRATRGL